MQYISGAKKSIIVENNATAQLNKLIKQTFGIECTEKILQYNGAPFAVEDLVVKLKEFL
jgi:2-oxoglutarate ferredoxin oxidoreductase subunit alpha